MGERREINNSNKIIAKSSEGKKNQKKRLLQGEKRKNRRYGSAGKPTTTQPHIWKNCESRRKNACRRSRRKGEIEKGSTERVKTRRKEKGEAIAKKSILEAARSAEGLVDKKSSQFPSSRLDERTKLYQRNTVISWRRRNRGGQFEGRKMSRGGTAKLGAKGSLSGV